MNQAVDCQLFLYVDDSSLLHQYKDVKQIEKNIHKNISNVFNWFVDNKLIIHFGYDKTKYKLNKVRKSGESMVLKVISKPDSRLRFLYRKKQM